VNLRWKTLAIIGGIVAIIVIVLLLVSDVVMLNGVANMEQKYARQNAERLLDALSHELGGLTATTLDYASWDDTYAFVQDNNTEYINLNLIPPTFINLRLNIMLFADASGQVVYGKAFDLLNKTEINIPQSLLEYLAANSLLLQHEDVSSGHAGVILLPECPLLVASRPVLTSMSEGPIAGALVTGRFLDSVELDYLYHSSHLPLSVQVLDSSQLPVDFQTAYSSLSKQEPVLVQPLDMNVIAGYVLISDIYENPILIMKFSMSRDFYAQGRASVVYVVFALAAVGMMFGGVINLLLEKFVLSRLSKLEGEVGKIGRKRDFAARVSLTGKDELSSLAGEINLMLAQLGETDEKFREERDRAQKYLDVAGVMIVALDVNGQITLLNRIGCEILGRSREKLVGKNWFDNFIPSRSRDEMKAVFKKILTEGIGSYFENPILTMSGEERLIAWFNTVLKDSEGKTIGTLSSGNDITEQRKAERVLQESEMLFRRITENMSDMVSLTDIVGTYNYVSPSVKRILGYEPKDLLGKTVYDFLHPNDLEKVTETIQRALQTRKPERIEYRYRRVDGHYLWLEGSGDLVLSDEGQVVGAVLSSHDITERKKIEEQLRESEERLRGIAERSFDAILTMDLEGRVTYISFGAERIIGYEPEEITGKSFHIFVTESGISKAVQAFSEVTSGKSVREVELELLRKDGSLVIVEMNGAPMIKDGKVVGVQVTARDISERKKAEQDLRDSEEKFRAISASAKDAIILMDGDGMTSYWNPAAERVFGYTKEEVVGKPAKDFLVPKEFRPIVDQGLEEFSKTGGGTMIGTTLELVGTRKDGTAFPMELSVSSFQMKDKWHALAIARDITERKKMEALFKESEERFRGITERSFDMIVTTDAEGRVVYVSPSVERILGFRAEEMIGKAFQEYFAESGLTDALQAFARLLEGEAIEGLQLEVKRKDGTLVTMEINVSPIFTGGEIVGIQGTARDISERRKMEHKLGETNKRLQMLLETASEGIITADPLDNVTFANKAFADILGYTEEELLGLNLRTLLDAQGLERIVGETESRKAGKISRYQLVLYRKDGEARTVQVTASPLWNEDGSFAGSLGIMMDATERKIMEEKIKESEERLRRFIEFAPDAIYVNDLNGNFVEGNRQAEEMTGYTKEEIIGKSMLEVGLLSEKYLPKALEALEKNSRGERTGPDEFELTKKDGSKIIVEISTFPLKRAGNVEILGIARDITERKKMENALRESEEKIRNILQSSPDAILVSDLNGNAIECNQASLNVFGVAKKEDLIGRSALEFVAAKDKERLLEDLVKVTEQGSIRNTEYTFKDANGREFPAEASASVLRDASGNPRYFVVIMEDITERKQMLMKLEEYSQQLEQMVEKRTHQLRETQEQLVKAERLAAIGQVAAMVGHDLRNPLTGIKGAAYYLKTKPALKADKKTMEILQLIEKDVEYSNKIITDLLEYSREIHLELTEATPKSIITETLSLLEVPTNVQVEDLTQDEPKIAIDIKKMDRVFVNLIKNAFDAMPQGGKLTIKSVRTDDNVSFVFTDTGMGMTKGQMEKAWTPFFTTKAKGMGLGLPICKRIVEAHTGKISVESMAGIGTTFTVTIPIEPKPTEGGEKVWVNVPESLLSTTTKA
jgi:PAS domain S-box-containing protein